MPSVIDRYPVIQPVSRRWWRSWLQRHHKDDRGVWIVYSKRSAGHQPLSYDDAVEEALCFGWIDSLVRAVDERTYRQLFTPRKPRSAWSSSNRRRVAAMIRAGLMVEAGMAKVRTAKKDGSWSSLASVERLKVPSDLAKILRSNERVRRGYARWNASTQRAVLWWLQSAKRDATRQRRLQHIVQSAASSSKPRPMLVTP